MSEPIFYRYGCGCIGLGKPGRATDIFTGDPGKLGWTTMVVQHCDRCENPGEPFIWEERDLEWLAEDGPPQPLDRREDRRMLLDMHYRMNGGIRAADTLRQLRDTLKSLSDKP